MGRSFALRLAVAFAAVGVAAAAVTALLVNIAFGNRFASYREEQQDARRAQLAVALEDAYSQADGWDLEEVRRITATALMDGGTVALEDPDGRLLWESSDNPMAGMHRQMMGTGPLGEARRVPIEVGGRVVGAAVVRFPQAGVLPGDVAFRTSVNRMVLAGAVIAGVTEAVASLREETLRLSRLINDLDTLVHADAAGFQPRSVSH